MNHRLRGSIYPRSVSSASTSSTVIPSSCASVRASSISCNGSMMAPRSPSTDPANASSEPRRSTSENLALEKSASTSRQAGQSSIGEPCTPELRASPIAVGCINTLSYDIDELHCSQLGLSEINVLEMYPFKAPRARIHLGERHRTDPNILKLKLCLEPIKLDARELIGEQVRSLRSPDRARTG